MDKTMDDFLSRIDQKLIYPPFLEKAKALVKACADLKAPYFATNGLRSYEEQERLYSYGRTDKSRGIVTKAPPGYSAHNYGVAIDFCRDGDPGKAGLQPDWSIEKYETLAKQATKLGLDAAYYWQTFKEGPHVQLNLKAAGITWPSLIVTYKGGGLKACWALFDKIKW